MCHSPNWDITQIVDDFKGSYVTFDIRLAGDFMIASDNSIVPYGPVLEPYRPIGDAKLSLDVLQPSSDALTTVLQVEISTNVTEQVGFLN